MSMTMKGIPGTQTIEETGNTYGIYYEPRTFLITYC